MATSLEIRDTVVDARTLDLIVPSPGHALEAEVLEVWVTWGDYRRVIAKGKPTGEWQRVPRRQRVPVTVANSSRRPGRLKPAPTYEVLETRWRRPPRSKNDQ